MNEEDQFDMLSETDSSDETQILKVEHKTSCFIRGCKMSFSRLDNLYDHINQAHHILRFQCKECSMYVDKYNLILKHKMLQHVGKSADNLYQCFYCISYSSLSLDELVDHLMTCVIINNDRDGRQMARFMKQLAKKQEDDLAALNNQTPKLNTPLCVDKNSGEVFIGDRAVSSFPDRHSSVLMRRKSIQHAVWSKRVEKSKVYDSHSLTRGSRRRSLMAPTGNLNAFLSKANGFSKCSRKNRVIY